MDRRRFLSLFGAGALGGMAGAGFPRPRQRQNDPDEDVESPTSGSRQIIWSIDTASPLTAVTFDDGPDPELTPQILDLLERYEAKATFMVMGYNALQHPALLDDIVAAGHDVGSHGWSHLNLAESTVAQTRHEIGFGRRVVEKRAGVPVRFFRPPHGRLTEAAVRLAALEQHDILMWSLSRGNLSWRSPDDVAEHVLGRIGPGEIVLLHDGIGRGTFHRGTEFADRLRRRRSVELKALPRILEGARARGLRLATVSDLMAARRPDARGA